MFFASQSWLSLQLDWTALEGLLLIPPGIDSAPQMECRRVALEMCSLGCLLHNLNGNSFQCFVVGQVPLICRIDGNVGNPGDRPELVGPSRKGRFVDNP
jgi:hypothetical protein